VNECLNSSSCSAGYTCINTPGYFSCKGNNRVKEEGRRGKGGKGRGEGGKGRGEGGRRVE
jgi:hypothetical protein